MPDIHVLADGAYTLTDDDRALKIPAGTAPADRAAQMAAFFGSLPAPVVEVAKVDLYRRMTPQEATDVKRALESQTDQMQGIFGAATTFRSDAPEWPELQAMAAQLFGPERAAELLSPSE